MSDLILYILTFLCGWFLIRLYLSLQNSSDNNRIRYTQVKQKMLLKVEEEPNQVYLWNNITDDFVAQGKDINEAVSRAIERFPNTTFYIKEDEIKV